MRSYDPRENTFIFGGQIIDGFGAGTFIKASYNEEGWSFQPSNSGSGTRSRNPNESGRVEVTLQYASPSNAVLTTFALADKKSGTGVAELMVKDRNTQSAKVTAENAWIIKIPDFERAKESGEITWIFESDALNIVHDGVIDA